MKKVLIISYYWPPSGGAGVQRWLKLSKYLQELGNQVYVIAPHEDDASYFAFDKSFLNEVHPDIHVVKTRSFEPVNIYKKFVGKKNVPTAGFSNVNKKNKLQQLSLRLRSNLFIPDPRKFWGRYAYKKAAELIKAEQIDCVITTSPPHSVQLIGYKLKQKLGVKWIADLRDLWTDVYYYSLLNHSKRSANKDASYELAVLQKADHVTTVSPNFVKNFLSKSVDLPKEKFSFIPNGYDPRDFDKFDYKYQPEFILTYTGTINLQYNFIPFLEGLKKFIAANNSADFKIRFVGFTDEQLKEEINSHGLLEYFDFVGYVSHPEAIDFLEKSYGLLLFGPLNTKKEEGGIPAKVFEYLASGRKILYLGKKDGFVSQILENCKGGKSFESDSDLIASYLTEWYGNFKSGQFHFESNPKVIQYSRKEQARQFMDILNRL